MNDAAFQAGIAGMSWGRVQGHRQGHQEGFVEGEEHGYAEGFQHGQARGALEGHARGYNEGKIDGWNDLAARVTPEIAKADQIIADLNSDRARLLSALEEQHALIEALEQRIRVLEASEAHLAAENGALRHAHNAMAETVTALKAANERLVADVAASNEQLGITQQERDNLRTQHNQALVFITTVRGVLNELVFGDSAEAERARIIFADKYQKRVATALAEGRISCPLEESAEFMRTFPGTHEFLRKLLDAIENDNARNSARTEESFCL